MDTVKNRKQETILKGLYLYRTLFSLFYRATEAFKAFQQHKVPHSLIWVEWDNFLLPWRKKVILLSCETTWKKEQKKVQCSSLQITEGSQKILSQKMPLHGQQLQTDRT